MAARPDVGRVLKRLNIEADLRGRDWWARCPHEDHEDKDGSWHVRDEPGSSKHGLFNCFGCGFKGAIVGLVRHVMGLPWREAIEWVGDDSLRADQRPVGEVRLVVRRDEQVCIPSGVSVLPFRSWPRVAREYAESRGIMESQADRWQVGYGYAGRYVGRLFFPKRLPTGELVGWSARTFMGDRRRYLEPEKWEAPGASGAVFGEQHWGAERRVLFLTEGVVNGLAVERALGLHGSARIRGHGIGAVSGSSLAAMQAVKLASWEQVIVFSDPDKAGDKLAEEVRRLLGRHGRKVVRARLPEGTDADSAGPRAILTALEAAS